MNCSGARLTVVCRMAWAVAREWSSIGAYSAERALPSDAYERADHIVSRWPEVFEVGS